MASRVANAATVRKKYRSNSTEPSINKTLTKPKSLKPLLSVSRPPNFDISGKGKAKDVSQREVISILEDEDEDNMSNQVQDDRLWVDRYEPQCEAELAVHKCKVEDVQRWLQDAFDGGPLRKLKKYRRILVLTGLAGTAKTTTVRILAKAMGLEVLEWRNVSDESYAGNDYDRETLNHKFDTFLARAATCRPLLGDAPTASSSSQMSRSATSTGNDRRQIILLKDLPNVLHQPTQAAFHSALESFVAAPPGTPLIIIISEASTRGEIQDEKLTQGGGGYSSREIVDVRTVLPSHFLGGPFVTQITFNPIAPTLMHRALQGMLSKHYANSIAPQSRRPSKEDLDIIVETSNGDIRSAIMALQFACVLDSSIHGGKRKVGKGKRKQSGGGMRALMEAVTRREQALALFHLIGKVLYNKRKGDPPNKSTSSKDKAREQEIDSRLRDPSPLPMWLSSQERRASRVDIDTLYADSPIDTGLFSLYIHQNYTQYCDDIDECGELSDWLSWIDSSGGEHWYQTNPHQFHLLTLGTLHSLPSPVQRRSQKMYKPEFFDALKKTREAEDELNDVRTWIRDVLSMGWSRAEIAQELGAVLKAWSRGRVTEDDCIPPPHAAFSTIIYSHSRGAGRPTLEDEDNDGVEYAEAEEVLPTGKQSMKIGEDKPADGGGTWLANDDIEEF